MKQLPRVMWMEMAGLRLGLQTRCWSVRIGGGESEPTCGLFLIETRVELHLEKGDMWHVVHAHPHTLPREPNLSAQTPEGHKGPPNCVFHILFPWTRGPVREGSKREGPAK